MVDVAKVVALIVRCFLEPLDHLFVPVDLLAYLLIAFVAVTPLKQRRPRFVRVYRLFAQKMVIMQGAIVAVSLQIELSRRVILQVKSMPG